MADELVDIVDDEDNVIGRDTRHNVHRTGARHRAVHILIFNGRGEMLLEKRSLSQDKCPGTYDTAAEHVRSGETYEDAFRRGLSEELGIRNVAGKKMVHFRMDYEDPGDRMMGVMYMLTYDGPLRIQKSEVEKVVSMPPGKIRKMLDEDEKQFAGWAREILRWYFGMPSRVNVIEVFKNQN